MTSSTQPTTGPGKLPYQPWPEPAQSALFSTLDAALSGVADVLTPICLQIDNTSQASTRHALEERYMLLSILRSSTRLQIALAQHARFIEKRIPF